MSRESEALERARQHEPRQLVLTSPVAAEIRYGIERLGVRTKKRRLLEREYKRWREVLTWSDWSADAADAFGRIKSNLEKRGTPLDDWDVAIAAAAESLKATVVSRNVDHFRRVRSIDVQRW